MPSFLNNSKQAKKPHKHGKRIHKNHKHKIVKTQKHIQKSFSPEYRARISNNISPLYHSDPYKPEMSELDETQQNYDEYIDKKTIEKLEEERNILYEMEITSKLAHINL